MPYRVADDPTGAVLRAILGERASQIAKWGEQSHDDPRWLAILTEELGEVAKEVCAHLETRESGRSTAAVPCYLSRLRGELVQVAAVAVAWCEHVNRLTGT